ncbi:hypothetical protein ACFSVJ_03745 [Prauserella oleivorans]
MPEVASVPSGSLLRHRPCPLGVVGGSVVGRPLIARLADLLTLRVRHPVGVPRGDPVPLVAGIRRRLPRSSGRSAGSGAGGGGGAGVVASVGSPTTVTEPSSPTTSRAGLPPGTMPSALARSASDAGDSAVATWRWSCADRSASAALLCRSSSRR